jgi:hypothetical protein
MPQRPFKVDPRKETFDIGTPLSGVLTFPVYGSLTKRERDLFKPVEDSYDVFAVAQPPQGAPRRTRPWPTAGRLLMVPSMRSDASAQTMP